MTRHGLRNEIMNLKSKYGISAASVVMRLGLVDILNESSVQHAFKTFARSWRTLEPEPAQGQRGYAALEKPSRFERFVMCALGEDLISPIRAASFLEKPLDVVEQQINGPVTS